MKPTPRDRVTEIRIAGLRCLEPRRVASSGVTGLIGENAPGRSGIVEGIKTLHGAAFPSEMWGGRHEPPRILDGRDAVVRIGRIEVSRA